MINDDNSRMSLWLALIEHRIDITMKYEIARERDNEYTVIDYGVVDNA